MDDVQKTDEGEASRAGIQSLDSALVVLQSIVRLRAGASLTEIARRSNMPMSKVHRYLASFAKAGLVRQKQRAGVYELAQGAIELGLAAMAQMDLVNEAAEHLEDLVLGTGAAGLIAVWGPHGPTVVRWQRSGSFVVTSMGLGTTLPLLNSATGRIFLAFSQPALLSELLQQEIARARSLGLIWPDFDPSKPDDLQRLQETTRERGYATVDGRFIPGLNAISVPVLNWQGEAEAAITLNSGDPAILRPDSHAAVLLREVCKKISVFFPK
ncbi:MULTISPECIES: IclR family transcriptional regulator [Rhizobium/Agrobacterium group]|uniref:IclR family transcriptional regulator n=1 Tax=Rhizobium/Agrobacterium group TaxID=227290 RepID=UPI001ADB6E7F|nr:MULTISPECIES: IclR family transcriptional regulator [Rhizobium/Agrobacterium group]MBO9112567.1 IclR family transcriptional regulator [Agrobacterium sp. S2/73]QXZ76072.1 IclR family transcriptional regulator [Agrobacterium sp. S7/73]QYA16921.1 IclR family transcriptional regulator [Rhizobium sp. AB2/73]UEQ85506.1 IclR family transcriptional regulator [Rhizobium sp. AB2/73]